MAKRSVRVNELVKRVLSETLRSDFREEAVLITITDVDIAPDLRSGKVYFSVLGDDQSLWKADRFFRRRSRFLQSRIVREITMKYTPLLSFIHDDSLARGTELLQRIDEISDDPSTENEVP